MMANKVVSATTVLLVSLAGISGTYAADGTLHATGDVTNSTCEVDVAGTTTQFGTIALGSIQKSRVATGNFYYSAGKAETLSKRLGKDFYLTFTNCPAGSSYNISATSPGMTYWGGMPNQGTATNIFGVIMYKTDAGVWTASANERPLTFGGSRILSATNTKSFDMDIALNGNGGFTAGTVNYQLDYTVDFL